MKIFRLFHIRGTLSFLQSLSRNPACADLHHHLLLIFEQSYRGSRHFMAREIFLLLVHEQDEPHCGHAHWQTSQVIRSQKHGGAFLFQARTKHYELPVNHLAFSNACLFAYGKLQESMQRIRGTLQENLSRPSEGGPCLAVTSRSRTPYCCACVAYIEDGSRFSSPSQIRNYIGLVPRIDQSGIREHIYGVNHFWCMPASRKLVQATWAVKTIKIRNPLTDKWCEMSTWGKKGQRTAVALRTAYLHWDGLSWRMVKSIMISEFLPSQEEANLSETRCNRYQHVQATGVIISSGRKYPKGVFQSLLTWWPH